MGSMLSKVPLPPTGVGHHLGPNADESGRYMRTVKVMGDAISNAIREAKFVEKTAADAGFDLSVGPPRPSTKPDGTQQQQGTTALSFHPLAPETDAYLNYMSRVAHTGTFLEQLTLLWAMEILYYRAWSQAASFTQSQSEALTLLINNWSAAEFASFVEILGDLLDGYGGSGDITRLDSDMLARVQGVWRQVVNLEKGFWEAGRGTIHLPHLLFRSLLVLAERDADARPLEERDAAAGPTAAGARGTRAAAAAAPSTCELPSPSSSLFVSLRRLHRGDLPGEDVENWRPSPTPFGEREPRIVRVELALFMVHAPSARLL
ncbi:hypothetical protein A4X03_0g3619 [Tilletia caries]|uniref:Thiaminase-2/PQQC domain-containing protein n=1 Tax=Tilletia caries TaxID=13290 RepID=A0A177UDF1_9BASI|nr:hypothetical protein CF335_g7972 [Tilletia laevis]KAE8261014.1 hypothetical protein A4X03_0g3619 [Tilletia caries]